jgi:hypothetical protein
MSREQAMKNLWMKSGLDREVAFIHTEHIESSDFAPICFVGQRIDPSRHSGVIPLRGASYQLSTIQNT